MARNEGRLQANTQRTEAVGAIIHEDSILPHDMNELRRLSLSLDFLSFPSVPNLKLWVLGLKALPSRKPLSLEQSQTFCHPRSSLR